MKAVVVHHNLNSLGGEASVAIETIQSLHDLGYEVYLVTIQKPDMRNILKTYGKLMPVKNIKSLFPFKLNYFGIYQKILTAFSSMKVEDVDLIINTNGGILPRGIPNNIPLCPN